jgi:hypothetical protein
MPGKGGRPAPYDPAYADRVTHMLAAEFSRVEIAAGLGIGLRTLQDWLRRGRAGEPPYAGFAAAFDIKAGEMRRIRCLIRAAKDREEGRERWRRFMAGREEWWYDHLGPGEFWRRRLDWLIARGYAAEALRTIHELRANGQGFGATKAP